MKIAKILMILILLLTLLNLGLSENYLSATCDDGMLKITWNVEGECVLTVYRNGWPISVCNVQGSDGGTRVRLPSGEGSYSVRLQHGDGCLMTNVDGIGQPEPTATAIATKEPEPKATPVATQEPKPTATPVVTQKPKPTATPVVTQKPVPTATPVAGQGLSDLAAQVVDEVNVERSRYGLSALTVDARLTEAACIRAQEIVEKFSHTRPDGTQWSTVSSYARGENIAKGHNSADRVMAAWMSSEGHRANILRESYGSIGVCAIRVDGVIYWVQLFGK